MAKCCVEGCDDVFSKDITYFNFPASKDLRRQWISALSRSEAAFKPKSNATVCSRHFSREDCESARGRTRLRAHAVPSVFPLTKEKQTEPTTTDTTQTIDKTNTTTDNGNNQINVESKQHNTIDNDLKTDKERREKNKSDLKDSSLNDASQDSEIEKRDLIETGEDSKDKREGSKELGESGLGSGQERVQDTSGGESGGESQESGHSSQDRSKNGAPLKEKQSEDIEDILTNYHILQDRPLNIHPVTDDPPPPATPTTPTTPATPAPDNPVFIEISVDKEHTSESAGKSDCLMVMESVEVELDPSELLMHADDDQDFDMETLDDDDGQEKGDPISLLTSSDEDDVIIEEPHIDTVEVSDETDEDDLPLVKLLKRRRAEKKKLPPPELNGEHDIAKILWGMYEYYCVQCHFTTSSGAEYRKHTASHAKVLMMCQICGYMTASETQFTKHEKQHGEKKYKCHLCSYKAKHNMSLLYHLKGHKAEDFIKKADMAVLKKAVHIKTSGKVFACRSCSYTTKKRCDLKRHTTRRHKVDDDEDFVP